MDRTQERFERFAQLRAAYPDEDYENIMTRIHDEEVEQDERDLLARLDAEDEERERLSQLKHGEAENAALREAAGALSKALRDNFMARMPDAVSVPLRAIDAVLEGHSQGNGQ